MKWTASQFKPMTFAEGIELINSLKRINLRNADINSLKQKLTPLLKGFMNKGIFINPDQIFYRGRTFKDKPSNIKELSYPPAEVVKQDGRCNRAMQSRFYCSVDPKAVFHELKSTLEPGIYVAVSHWKVKAELLVNNIGYSSEVFQALSSSRTSVNAHFHLPYETPLNRQIYKFLSTEFSKEVSAGCEHLYKMSIAITEKLNSEYKSGPSIQFDGLLYPAIAMCGNTDNLMLVPNSVDKRLECTRVEYYRVDSIDQTNKTYSVTLLDFADSIKEGSIEWKGRPPRWSVPPGETMFFAVENGKWIAKNSKGETVLCN